MAAEQHLGEQGTYLCHYFEQLKLRAYPDPGSPLFKALMREKIDPYSLQAVPAKFVQLSGAPWTIGWGDTGPDVVPGLVITAEQADQRFARRMSSEFEPGVRAAVRLVLAQHEFDALVSIFYNVGVGAMRASTLVRKLNAGDRAGAAAEFPRWNKSAGERSKGLDRRREAERVLFLGTAAREAIAAALRKFP